MAEHRLAASDLIRPCFVQEGGGETPIDALPGVSYQCRYSDARGVLRGSEFAVIFAGTKHWQVAVRGSGPGLRRAYDLVTLHRLPFLRGATDNEAKFAAKGATVFTSIEAGGVTAKGEE